MAKISYPIVIHQEKDCFWISFPDLPGCYCSCESLKKANAQSAAALIEYCIAETEIYQRKMPKASSVLKVKKAFPEDTVRTISIDTLEISKRLKGDEVRKVITLPKWLIEQAEKQNLNLNQLINEILLDHILNNKK